MVDWQRHGSALQAGEADDDVLGERDLNFEEAAIIEDLTDDGFDIIGFGGIRWYQVAQGEATSVSRVLCALDRRSIHVVQWQMANQITSQVDRLLIAFRCEVGYARLRSMGHGSTEILECDLLVGDRLDDLWSGDEHVS